MLSLSLFTLRKHMKSALEFEVGKKDLLKMSFGQGEETFHMPAHLQTGTEIKQFHRLHCARQKYQSFPLLEWLSHKQLHRLED